MTNHGGDKILVFRGLSNKTVVIKLALQTEHKWKYERKSDLITTKDGPVVLGKGLEVTPSIEAASTRDELNTMLEKFVIQSCKLEA